MRPAGFTLCALLFGAGFAWAQTAPEPPSITTQGQAVFKVTPDLAWVSFRVEGRGNKPGEAQRKAAEVMDTLQDGVRAAGVPTSAIRTTSYTLQPELEWSNGVSRIKSYVTRNTIDVRVDDLGKLGGVVDAAGASGAASISAMRFDVKIRDAVERDALAAASKDAMSRARAIAEGLGGSLGAILRVQDQRVSSAPVVLRMLSQEPAAAVGAGGRGGGTPPTPIEPGEIEIRAMLTLVIGVK
jgi:uncharacterized protein YggE